MPLFWTRAAPFAAPRGTGAALAILAISLLSVGASDALRRRFYTTADEPVHVLAARELRSDGLLVSNFEHPVLTKSVAALASAPSGHGATWTDVKAARRPFPWFFGMLVLATGLSTLAVAGPAAGIAAAALTALEPTLRGHGPLVHTDIPVAALLVVAAALANAAVGGGRLRPAAAASAGVAFGLALATKFSALFFLPAFLAVVAASTVVRRGPRTGLRLFAATAGVLLPVAFLTLLSVQEAVAATTPREVLREALRASFGERATPPLVPWAVDTLSPGAAAWTSGLVRMLGDSRPGTRTTYFLGKVSDSGHVLYFPVALALKTTVGTLVLLLTAVAGAAALLASGRTAARRRHGRLLASRCLLPGGLGVSYLLMASLSSVNIGVRHVAPAVPFLVAAACGAVATLPARKRSYRTLLLSIAVVAAGAEALSMAGREISFGNLLAGGPHGLRRFLADSNVDWGQSQHVLFDRVARGDLGRTGLVAGGFDVAPTLSAGIVPLRSREQFLAIAPDAVAVQVSAALLAKALVVSRDLSPRLTNARATLTPLVGEVFARAVAVEDVADGYLLVRLRRPPNGPP